MADKILGNLNTITDSEYRDTLPFGWRYSSTATIGAQLYLPDYVKDEKGNKIKIIQNILIERRKKRVTDAFPVVLNNKYHALLYVSIVNYELNQLNEEDKEILIRAASGDHRDVVGILKYGANYNWCRSFCKPFNTNISRTALILGDYLKMSPENIFERFPLTQKDYDLRNKLVCPVIPDFLSVDDISFKLVGAIPIYHANGTILQKICLYSYESELIVVYAGESTNFGRNSLPARLPNDNLMNDYGHTVYVFLCADIAWAAMMTAQASNLYSKSGAIVTGCLRGLDDFNAIDLKKLIHHNVILICSPDRCEWDHIDDFVKHCEKACVSSIRIYPYIIDSSANLSALAQIKSLPDSLMTKIKDRCKNPDWGKSYIDLFNSIERFGIPFNELDIFKRKIGLAQECEDKYEVSKSEINYYDETLALTANKQIDSNFDLTQLITKENRTLIYAPSNAGKSFFSLQLAISLSTGTPSFCFSCSKNKKVVILDGEMGDKFHVRLRQLTNGDNNLLCKSEKMLGQYNVRNNNLHDEIEKNHALQVIFDAKAEVVFIDNIISVFPKTVRGNLDDLQNFIHQLEDRNIAVVMIHHTDKQGKEYKGPVELESLAQNVFRLKGKEEVANELKKDNKNCDEVCRILNLNGAFIELNVKKCKVYPHLEHQNQYYFLPANEKWTHATFDGSKLSITENTVIQSNGKQEIEKNRTQIVNTDPRTAQCSNEEQLILVEANNQGNIKNKEVQKLLGCSDSKASNLLGGLTVKSLLKVHGKGRGVYYTPT